MERPGRLCAGRVFPGTQALRVAASVHPCSWKVGRESWNPQASRIQGGPFPRESGQIPVTPRDPVRELISLPSLEDDITPDAQSRALCYSAVLDFCSGCQQIRVLEERKLT